MTSNPIKIMVHQWMLQLVHYWDVVVGAGGEVGGGGPTGKNGGDRTNGSMDGASMDCGGNGEGTNGGGGTNRLMDGASSKPLLQSSCSPMQQPFFRHGTSRNLQF